MFLVQSSRDHYLCSSLKQNRADKHCSLILTLEDIECYGGQAQCAPRHTKRFLRQSGFLAAECPLCKDEGQIDSVRLRRVKHPQPVTTSHTMLGMDTQMTCRTGIHNLI